MPPTHCTPKDQSVCSSHPTYSRAISLDSYERVCLLGSVGEKRGNSNTPRKLSPKKTDAYGCRAQTPVGASLSMQPRQAEKRGNDITNPNHVIQSTIQVDPVVIFGICQYRSIILGHTNSFAIALNWKGKGVHVTKNQSQMAGGAGRWSNGA